jgi:hypothetical protein
MNGRDRRKTQGRNRRARVRHFGLSRQTTPDVQTQLRVLAAGARVVQEACPSENRGRRESRVRRSHPQPRVEMKKPHEHSHHRFAGFTQPSLHNGFNVYSVLSPVTGLFCHRHRRNCFRRLNASVGAPGPHGFSVRNNAARLAPPSRPLHPAPNVRDDRDTPLLVRAGRGGGNR